MYVGKPIYDELSLELSYVLPVNTKCFCNILKYTDLSWNAMAVSIMACLFLIC